MLSKRQHAGKRKTILMFIGLVAVGILLNILGTKLNGLLGLPFYLDNIGTILTAAVGGYLPCIAVGFFYNIVMGISDTSTFYYCFISVLIAWAAAFFDRKGYLYKLPHVLLAITVFGIFGGLFGGVLTWFLNGMTPGEGFVASMTEAISHNTGISLFSSSLVSNVAIDLVDKAITTVISLLLWKLIPKRLLEQFDYFKQSVSFRRHVKQHTGVSIRFKALLTVGISTTLVTVSAVVICVMQYHSSTVEEYIAQGREVTQVIANRLDRAKVESFLSMGEEIEEYNDMQNMLRSINDSSVEISFIYAYQIRPEGAHVVLDMDAEGVIGDSPGVVLPLDDVMKKNIKAFSAGEEIEPVITSDEYGWLLTVYHPVNDDKGNICYTAVDLSMERLAASELAFLSRIISLFMGFLSLILIFAMWMADHYLAEPINRLTAVAGSLAFDTPESRAASVERIRSLNLLTGDEIESLYHAMASSTESTVHFIEEVEEKGEQINRLQNGLILVLADLVESRDRCTGDHVRKTAAYVRIIVRQMKRDGVYDDQLTEEFMSDVEHSAPLHDIGKIQIPDALLNKPGKLTDEEFKIMQSHAAAGGEIIEKAIETVGGDSGYLREAQNLAASHHEKWNGRGYPQGLAGEDIPLSARIMAVADVFDALISRRSYKEPFPVDKAIDIIREEAGKHFDAKIVQSFLNAEDEIRRVAAENSDE